MPPIHRFPEGVESEQLLGFTRVMRVNDTIIVGGTTARPPQGEIWNAYEQAMSIFRRVLPIIEEAGGDASTVYRLRGFVTNIADDAEIMRAVRDSLSDNRPAATIVEVSRIAREGALVEIELEALARA